MDKNELLIIADLSHDDLLSVDELCEICQISPQFVQQLVAYEIILPISGSSFNAKQTLRLKSALRLQRHLDMNLASVAIVLDLLDELKETQAQLNLLKKL